ncbi:NACHT domain-containing protein [Micromonospora sp. NBC_01796]|uniref:NACHT domain-containing protein n=1 Tax=Micromonospora sp. NBC_01796 TaxID=2975987 RepID=UPI002DDA0DEC|nr:NACHT domain-containing protein [Micromonospora sp. NBC_01796]WSA86546.1 NACHT domain-containing protein [Micromonospora sp. NBC_01796]
MTGVEQVLMKLGSTIVTTACKSWLTDRQRRAEARLPLSELINRRLTDEFDRRKLHREIEAMTDAVAHRLTGLTKARSLPEHERQAALDAVVDAFTRVGATDEAFFAADADGSKLASAIRSGAADTPDRAGLGEVGRRMYDLVLDECCDVYAQTVIHLNSFAPRATTEVLARLTSQGTQLNGMGEYLTRILARLPVRSLDAPSGTDLDEEFRRRYLTQVSTVLDELELLGVDVRQYRPRTTLSVAYVSLTVSETGQRRLLPRRGPRPDGWLPGSLRRGEDTDPELAESGAVRVEAALGRSHRTLIRGEAGSGKTTILRWLAITAARGAFTGELADWNGLVPFLVVLRRYPDRPLPSPEQLVSATTTALAGLAPLGWTHRQLALGQALLLVDGVDELPASARRRVREWLRELLTAYPMIRVVVTSRPAAATARWLSAEDFGSTVLEPMSPADVRALVSHWHRAVRDSGDLPCPVEELSRYEHTLIGRLDASAHLHALATTPLLCAMLCALNLDRRTHLPPDRMSLYAAAVDLLLQRRDVERDIVWSDLALTGRDKLNLMQYVACRMSINGESETPRERVVERLGHKIASMPQVDADPELTFDYLLERGGLIRQPVPGRVDFVHRTFQEYLTAREVADLGDMGMLVERAHRDTWRETIILAAGQANARSRDELIAGILRRAETEPDQRRVLRLVAASCLETVPALEPELLGEVRSAIDALVPPRTPAEARTLAAVGEPLLRHLPPTLDGLTAKAAAHTVRTAALVNGPQSLGRLAGYAADPRAEVQQELIRVWDYFDPHEYAQQVLADAPLLEGCLDLANLSLLPALPHLRRLAHLDLVTVKVLDLTELDDVPHLRDLALLAGTRSPIKQLKQHAGLRYLYVSSSAGAVALNPEELSELAQLAHLCLWQVRKLTAISFVSELTNLRSLMLNSLDNVTDYTPLDNLPALTDLSLHSPRIDFYTRTALLHRLTALTLSGVGAPPDGISELVGKAPQLEHLTLGGCNWVESTTPLTTLTALKRLSLPRTRVSELGPLAELTQLRHVDLEGCTAVTSLAPLAGLPHLSSLSIAGIARGTDLSPFAGRRGLTITLGKGQDVRGLDRLGSGVRVLVRGY